MADTLPPELASHVDMAFARATLVSLTVAVTAATLTALVVAVLVTRRAVRPIREMSVAATAVAHGDYSVRVQEKGFGSELVTLSQAFNGMAQHIASTERTRGEMLRDLAHELRTPLTSVRGYHEAIADGVLPADRATFDRVDAELSRIERLVDDLAAVSRAEERGSDLRLRPVQVAELLAGAARSASLAFHGTGVTVQVEGGEGGSWVLVDSDRLHEALMNLISNAVRYTPPGGTVSLRSRAVSSTVKLEVQDTGEGIAAEHLQRVFERFYRVDHARSRSTGGSGIGLTITRALIHAHGGRIHAQSTGVGHGTTFVITLPRCAPASGNV
ncbi:HAMP domain-containing protein [Cellulomonas humilata]|uniref:Signal transduction histidine-protein kinase/phosphatase MprB n=1 Tax=Cellulomonas humilata TaxID=144055 RepID=A0A7Y5ZYZ5_9CELL|nr:HAMP domain-containing protein [Cellulomonas humilata]